MKYAIGFFSVLVFIVGAILLVQYQVFSKDLKLNGEAFYYSQEIQVEYRDQNLYVQHQFKNLPKQEVEIQWPTAAKMIGCTNEDSSECSRLTEDKRKFNSDGEAVQKVSYVIPTKGGLKSGELLQNIFAQLNTGSVKFSMIHISTSSKIGGQWVTGLPQVGEQSLKLVKYSMFSGDGQVETLYWQQTPSNLQEITDLMTVYSTNKVPANVVKSVSEMQLLNEQHFAIVQSKAKKQSSGRILFVEDFSVDKLQEAIVHYQVSQLYNFKTSAAWLKEFVGSSLLEKPSQNTKVQQIQEALSVEMTSQQKLDWKKALESLQGEVITSEILDEALSKVLGNYTRYITLNSKSKVTHPFVYNDEREIYVGEVIVSDEQVIFVEGSVYYSAQPLLTALGYKAEEGKNGYYVKNEVKSFRFPKKHKFYVFNQRRYNTPTQPIEKIGGVYYIEESWLQRLFVVDVEKSEEIIKITPTVE